MASLHLTPDAQDGYDRICDDPSLKMLCDQIDRILDQLEADPGDARMRRHRFHQANLWAIYVWYRHEQWAVLWRPDSHHLGDVSIAYIGPASFA